MKRIQEKVRDIVEVRPFSILSDYSADPAQTLAGYYFTDITADLAAKWLGAIVNLKTGQGNAVALAGFRGVGKSHFLAVLAAILSRPELRDKITDQYVTAVADRLPRRHHTVAFVRRGSCDTLLEELKSAIAAIFGLNTGDLSDSLNDLLLKASEMAGDLPLVLLFDTALGRDTRVARDDGPILSEIAETAKSLGIFVGLALDDDIEGADGANSSISGSFAIDYLDQEHLYKIVDSHIFVKKDQSLSLLKDIYKNYSSVLPAFRWSEQRFTSLYPLHPATLEIAPVIRLYLHDFALLGFASEAGVRILGRPAHSLIGLDEVFDAVEGKLRLIADLKDAFTAFDELDHEIVGKSPVSRRLPSKLILKGLFMLSLDGQGTSASDIAASMLIFDENAGSAPGIDISLLLASFADALPDSISISERVNEEPRYCFKLSTADDLNTMLETAIDEVPLDAVMGILLRQASEKYSDLIISAGSDTKSTTCSVEWRGAIRHGEIRWGLEKLVPRRTVNGPADWTATVAFEDDEVQDHYDNGDQTRVFWRLGELRSDEIAAIKQLHILQTNVDLRDGFEDRLTTVSHMQSLAVEKIWKRVFLTDSRFIVGKSEYGFSDEAQRAHTLAHLFTIMLGPVFEYRYPEHPAFPQLLGVKEAAKLTGQFFGGAAESVGDIQKLAEAFALPLGLVELQEEHYVSVPANVLAALPVVRASLDGLQIEADTVVKLAELSARMLAAPFGLTHEAQHLVLAALVAQRQFEFVTINGNRINHRSLDLQIIWDDIEGIAHPFTEIYTAERLRDWAVLITGNKQIKSLERSEDRLVIIDTLSGWLANWKEAGFLERFESLPDDSLNSSIWRIAANLRKTFGALAECIDGLIQNVTPLDQCLHNIADLFSDSETEYEKKKKDLILLRYFTHGAVIRDEISAYLSVCEATDDDEIERLRLELLEKISSPYVVAEESRNTGLGDLWQDFKERYIDYYVEKHDAAMNSKASAEKLNELLRSDRWRAFESLSDLAWFDQHVTVGAKALIRRSRHAECEADVRQLLASKPFCSCSFNLARFERRRDQSSRLEIIMNQGLLFFRARINEHADELMKEFDRIKGSGNLDLAASLKRRLSESADVNCFSNLTSPEIQFLRSAIRHAENRSAESPTPKRSAFEDFSDLLPNEVRAWEDEIDNLEVFSNTKP